MNKMAAKMSSMKCVILFAIIAVLWLQTVECRRGGGSVSGGRGSRGGGFRSSRGSSRGSSRVSSSSRVRLYRGPSYTRGSWKTAAAAGAVFGLASYKTRRLYKNDPNREPTICFNELNLKNDTYGYFVCPQQHQQDNLDRCCGPEYAERCCKERYSVAAVTAGATVGGTVFALLLSGIIIFCKHRSKKRAKSGNGILKQPKAINQSSKRNTPFTLNTGNNGALLYSPSSVYQPSNKNTPVTLNTGNDGALPYSPSPATPKSPIPEGDAHGGLPYPAKRNITYQPQDSKSNPQQLPVKSYKLILSVNQPSNKNSSVTLNTSIDGPPPDSSSPGQRVIPLPP